MTNLHSNTTLSLNNIDLNPVKFAFDTSQTISKLGRVHFIGIGGAGMSVLAEMLHEEGAVSYTHLTLPTKRIV